MKNSKNIIVILTIIFIVFIILIGYFSFNCIKYAKEINIFSFKFIFLNKNSLKNIELYRISPTDKVSKILGENDYYIIDEGYIKNIRIMIPKDSLPNIKQIQLSIGNKVFKYDYNDFIYEWPSIDNKNEGKLVFELPEDVKVSKSYIPIFSNIINWPGDFKILARATLKAIMVLSILIFMILIIYFGNLLISGINYSKCKIFNENKYRKLFIILMIVIIILLSFLPFNSTGAGDVKYFLKWMHNYYEYGFLKGYSEINDNYPPLGYIIIALEKNISLFFNIEEIQVFKITIILFLFLTSLVFYFFTKDIFITILLNLSFLLCGPFLGYIDIFFAPFLIISLFSLYNENYIKFSIFYTISCLIKYQPIIILPFICLFLIKINNIKDLRKINYKEIILKIFIPSFIVLLFFIALFNIAFFNSFKDATSHSFLSSKALNLNWIIQYFYQLINNNINLGQEIGYFEFVNTKYIISFKIMKYIFLLVYFFILYNYFFKSKNFKNFLYFSLLGYFTYYILNIGVHQHHLFLCVILSAILWFYDKKNALLFFLISIIFNINLFVFYGMTGKGLGFSRIILGIDFSIFFAFINFIVYIILFIKIILYKQNLQENIYE